MSYLISGASLAFVIPVLAIDQPEASDFPKVKPAQSENKEVGQGDSSVKEVGEVQKKAQKKHALIGLGGAPVSKALALHLKLPEGQGLTLFHVIPDSPAAKAGLEEYDIVTDFDGKVIGSQRDLRRAIWSHQPGDEVAIRYIHKGEAIEKKVVLGERPARMGAAHVPGVNQHWMFKGLGAQVPEADRKRMEKEIKKRIEKMQKDLERQGALGLGGQAPKNAAGKAQPRARGFQINASSSITVFDDEGSITLKSVKGKKEVVAKDKEGKIIFEGPYETPQDKAALPDDLSERVEKLKLNEVNAKVLRIEIDPRPLPQPTPDEDEDAQ